MKSDFWQVHPDEFQLHLKKIKEPIYRGMQLYEWIYGRGVNDLDEMTNIPGSLRTKLHEDYDFSLPTVLKTEIALDGTTKFLLELEDGERIETVMIPNDQKRTLCVSSQVGCRRGCQFCATADLGFRRNLTTAEIVKQIDLVWLHLKPEKITNIVFMGMGEPLDNFDNVINAIRLIQHGRTFNFSPRRITLSTVGIIEGIEKLAQTGLKLKLAVSLNSAIQSKREAIMPVAKQYGLTELKKALLDYRKKSAYRITFEYILIGGFNTKKEDRKALKRYLGDISCKLNLLSWNGVESKEFAKPTQAEIDKFVADMQDLSAAVTFRKSRGQDINAACGQLAAEYKRGE
jgi:23S rRNA (adenine2503-C2)-methyltransferase